MTLNGMPLARFKVLDLCRARAGPTCVRQLADWGADTIKIETPAGVPGAAETATERHGFDFFNIHRNKRSLGLNLKEADGRKIFLQLAETADVVVENYRPGVKHRLGIDYEAVRAVNPRIVYASLSGFGQEGAMARGDEAVEPTRRRGQLFLLRSARHAALVPRTSPA